MRFWNTCVSLLDSSFGGILASRYGNRVPQYGTLGCVAGRWRMTGTQAVDRAATLLARVVRANEPLAFSALAEETGLPRSTTSRLLAALERNMLLARDVDGSFLAGPLFSEYAAGH